MNHTHTYWHWHAHKHRHQFPLAEPEYHDTGHYHEWIGTHDHGKGGVKPHSHQVKWQTDADDKQTVHHHRVDDHTILEEGEEQVQYAPIRYKGRPHE